MREGSPTKLVWKKIWEWVVWYGMVGEEGCCSGMEWVGVWNVIIGTVDSKYESKENNGAWVKSKRSEWKMGEITWWCQRVWTQMSFPFFCFVLFRAVSKFVRTWKTQLNGNFDGLFIQKILTYLSLSLCARLWNWCYKNFLLRWIRKHGTILYFEILHQKRDTSILRIV